MSPSPLPIDELIPTLLGSLIKYPSAIVVAPPGAGKTTRIPSALVQHGLGKTILLQPRRVAARSVSKRIAQENNWTLGREVGYQVRFDRCLTNKTQLRVLTEGILTRQIQSDPFLEDINCVILDEFHERNLHTDLALALLREIQQEVRPDLKIIVMSATMDPKPVAAFLDNAPVFESKGRMFPVETIYTKTTSQEPIWDKCSTTIHQALNSSDSGHLLVFLPGMKEIRRTQERLSGIDAEIHILHSSISSEDQDKALSPTTIRKVILATNIAETSITIEGVRTVIDSGTVRVLVNDPRLGIDRLELRRISQASATQRRGRAGRTAPGRCYRLWTSSENSCLEENDSPEIHRIDLSSTLLTLRAYGITDPGKFHWFAPPKEQALLKGEELIRELGAIDQNGQLTPNGKVLATLPLHPRLGQLLIQGARMGLGHEAAGIAALLSERDILTRGRGPQATSQWEGDSDVLDRLDLLEGTESYTSGSLNRGALSQAYRVRQELIRYIPKDIKSSPVNPAKAHDQLKKLLLLAYPDRVTVRRPNDPSRGLMVGGRGIRLDNSSTVRTEPIFLSIDLRDPEKGSGGSESITSIASSIERDWLLELFPQMIQEKLFHLYDPEKEKISSTSQTIYMDLVIREKPASPNDDPQGSGSCLYHGLSEKVEAFFSETKESAQWLDRARFLHRSLPESGFPSFDKECLLTLLRDHCQGKSSANQLRQTGLRHILESALDWSQQQVLKKQAPETLSVPSGNNIRLKYPESGPPVLAVRLQELFGMSETPCIAKGRVAVTLHLLAPNFQPVQITQDLKNFWDSTYQEVKKELKARYPKHPWPEDPWNAPPKSVGGRRHR